MGPSGAAKGLRGRRTPPGGSELHSGTWRGKAKPEGFDSRLPLDPLPALKCVAELARRARRGGYTLVPSPRAPNPGQWSPAARGRAEPPVSCTLDPRAVAREGGRGRWAGRRRCRDRIRGPPVSPLLPLPHPHSHLCVIPAPTSESEGSPGGETG